MPTDSPAADASNSKPGRRRTASKSATKPLAKAAGTTAPAKHKLVRDGFTMPANEYALIAELKGRALAMAHHVKKSELLRAGLMALAGMSDPTLLAALQAVPAIRTGRPKKVKGDKTEPAGISAPDAPELAALAAVEAPPPVVAAPAVTPTPARPARASGSGKRVATRKSADRSAPSVTAEPAGDGASS